MPYSAQTASGNPMVIPNNAALGIWSYKWIGTDSKNIVTGTFTVSEPPSPSSSLSPSPSPSSSPTPTPTPTPTPSPSPALSGGIPGYPYEALVVGIVLAFVLLWLLARDRAI